jgi:hypothetical protein
MIERMLTLFYTKSAFFCEEYCTRKIYKRNKKATPKTGVGTSLSRLNLHLHYRSLMTMTSSPPNIKSSPSGT